MGVWPGAFDRMVVFGFAPVVPPFWLGWGCQPVVFMPGGLAPSWRARAVSLRPGPPHPRTGANLMNDLFTSAQAAELAGVSYRQLDWAASRGLVTPVIGGDAPGSGRRRRWDLVGVTELAVVGAVRCVAGQGTVSGSDTDLAVAVLRELRSGGVLGVIEVGSDVVRVVVDVPEIVVRVERAARCLS